MCVAIDIQPSLIKPSLGQLGLELVFGSELSRRFQLELDLVVRSEPGRESRLELELLFKVHSEPRLGLQFVLKMVDSKAGRKLRAELEWVVCSEPRHVV